MAHILFAVSDVERVQVAAEYLQNQGHHVVIELDGRTAEQYLRQNPPDILVTTVLLMVRDGLALGELLKQIRPSSAALLLTALDPEGKPLKSWKGDFEAYCISGDPWQIILCVEQLIEFEITRRSTPL